MHVDRMNYVGKPITMKMGYILFITNTYVSHFQ